MARVFTDFVEGLARELREHPLIGSAELKTVKEDFSAKELTYKGEVAKLKSLRISNLLDGLSPALREGDGAKSARDALAQAYEKNFTTAAFQNGLFITFFAVVNTVNAHRQKPETNKQPLSKDDVSSAFTAYLENLNTFFRPSSRDRLEKLLSSFSGKVSGSGDDIKVVPWQYTLRHILVPGELNPNEWPKLRPVFAELWNPKLPEFKAVVNGLREQLRREALQKFVRRRLDEKAVDLGRNLEPSEILTTESECVDLLYSGLANLTPKLKREDVAVHLGSSNSGDG